MTFLDEGDAASLFDGHGDHQHVPVSRSKDRIGVLIVGSALIVAVIGGMFLY